jgi:hypothetical protein
MAHTTLGRLRLRPEIRSRSSVGPCTPGRQAGKNAFARLVEALGADRFLFGTGMPFKAAAIARGSFERVFC